MSRTVYDHPSMTDEWFDKVFKLGVNMFPFVYENATKRIESSGGMALDIGSGTDELGTRLQHMGFEVTGVDLANEMMSLGNPDIRHVRGDATHLPFADETFDLIVSNWTMHHIEDTKKFFSEVDRVCKSDCEIVISDFRPNRLQDAALRSDFIKGFLRFPIMNDLVGTLLSIVSERVIRDAIDELGLGWTVEKEGFMLYIRKRKQ